MSKVLVVLGHKTERIRRQRAEAAVKYLAAHSGVAVVVFSGYSGEAASMSRFAFPDGIASAPCTVLLEEHSTHTLDNLRLTARLLCEHGHDPSVVETAVIAHRGLHATRAWQCARRFFRRVQTIGVGAWFPREQPFLQFEEAWKIPARTLTGDLFPGDRIRETLTVSIRINP